MSYHGKDSFNLFLKCQSTVSQAKAKKRHHVIPPAPLPCCWRPVCHSLELSYWPLFFLLIFQIRNSQVIYTENGDTSGRNKLALSLVCHGELMQVNASILSLCLATGPVCKCFYDRSSVYA